MASEPARNDHEPVDEFLKRTIGEGQSEVKFPGRETAKLQDPALADEVHRRLSMEPLPEGVYAPITLALPASLPPVEYVMHVWTYKCTLCNSEHKHSEIYALNHLRSRSGFGAFVRNMSPVASLEWNVPLKVHNLTTRTSAGCFECLEAIREEILPTLRTPPVPQAILKSAPEAGAQAPARPVGSKKGPSSTEDFML